ncbi:hypothetical protein CHRY9390_00282 [Chryseobacterium aquaeductus]|uniref:3-oxoacyl-ACP synthase n=1 Tax=Chryseobacterium aquaeductus TaxID=2675056 RepID=A0A9N8MEG1_9FLAO|nr:hypothetical protein [Chryseobacterium aquaeductus]CAA7329642.1 hypothetical protein CHRY9390_00282 [Chryseobacterium potabilaquae]CAD7798108.1 hypothetical protein CHRY9390_00282 [Chryseobacterium aquaeductus]
MNKKEILQILKDKISAKIQSFENLITETRASSNDTKSSMGDKYETGREMLQQEINNIQRQLNETLNQQNFLHKLNTEICTKVQNGALVKTDKGLFYISVSAGEIVFQDQKIMTISTESPLAIAMWNKNENELFTLNGQNQKIEYVS